MVQFHVNYTKYAMRRQTFSSAIGKTLQYRNFMSLQICKQALVWPCFVYANSYSSLHMLESFQNDSHTPIEFTCCNRTLTCFSGGNKIPLWLQYQFAAKHPSCALFTHVSLGQKCRLPQVSAVPRVKGFELGCFLALLKNHIYKISCNNTL